MTERQSEAEYLAEQRQLRRLFRSLDSPGKLRDLEQELVASGLTRTEAVVRIQEVGEKAVATVRDDLHVGLVVGGFALFIFLSFWAGRLIAPQAIRAGGLQVTLGTLLIEGLIFVRSMRRLRRLRDVEESLRQLDA